MEEILDDMTQEEASPEADLSGVDPELHDFVKALLRNRESPDSILEQARRVVANKDGSVIVKLKVPVRLPKDAEEHDRIRLRPLKVRDYRSGVAIDAESEEFDAMLKLGHALANAKHQAVLDEIGNAEDMRAVYFGVQLARKNFSRPTS